MGFGVLPNGRAAVILGETLIGRASRARQVGQVLVPAVGAAVDDPASSFALAPGLAPSDLRFRTGPSVPAILAIPSVRGRRKTRRMRA